MPRCNGRAVMHHFGTATFKNDLALNNIRRSPSGSVVLGTASPIRFSEMDMLCSALAHEMVWPSTLIGSPATRNGSALGEMRTLTAKLGASYACGLGVIIDEERAHVGATALGYRDSASASSTRRGVLRGLLLGRQ
jgi:hypothetical protein